MARADRLCPITISDSEPDDVIVRPPRRKYKPGLYAALARQSLELCQSEPLRSSQVPSNSPANRDEEAGLSHWSPLRATKPRQGDMGDPFILSGSPIPQAPRQDEVTVASLASSLRDFSQEIGANHAKLTLRLIRDAWKRDTPQPQLISKKDWFSGMRLEPVPSKYKVAEAMHIKTKQMGHGKAGKQEKRELYPVICIKTKQEPTPRYTFHHVEVKRNILSPNTMLTYVPHIRDLADSEEKTYRRWLENLEAMDKTSGFATLSRQEKVAKTIQRERATTLLESLDIWLPRLGIEHCTKAALLRYMAGQKSDAVTPREKSSSLNPCNDGFSSPRTHQNVQMFVEAFDRIFDDSDFGDHAVSLRDVLLLDKSTDTNLDSKKSMKDTPSQSKAAEELKSVESFLETYSVLGCLICTGNSCEHGDYSLYNERIRFSVEILGGFTQMLRQQLARRLKGTNSNIISPHRAEIPCGEECYLQGSPSSRSRPWNQTEFLLLKSFYLCFYGTSIPVQCLTAVATGRPCWDVQRQMERISQDSLLPDIPKPLSSPVRPLPWYDRYRKMLIGDWQEHTRTHEHERRERFEPCSHEGPCDKNCPCVRNHVMCERFCFCTAETCANKFTGCACHSLGKTCLSKQKDRPCICIMLNRECDPVLCGTCGASARAMPKNIDNEALHATGCQNCALQRGKTKAVVVGKSKVSGYGLYTTEDIAQDEFVIEYVGELISQDEGVRREARRGNVFDESSNPSYLFTLLDQEGIWVDAAIYGNLSRYINHQDTNCNVMPKIVFVNGEFRIKFSSLRDIKAGEELFFHYGENFPNLTQKLPEGEKSERKRRKYKEQVAASDDGEKGGKKPGRKPVRKLGRKSGPKPKKTTSFSGSSSKDHDEAKSEPADDPFIDIRSPLQSKRKSIVIHDSYSDSSEYESDIGDSQEDMQSGRTSGKHSHSPQHAVKKRKRFPNGTFASDSYEAAAMGLDGKGKDYSPKRGVKKSRTLSLEATMAGANGDQPGPLFAMSTRQVTKPFTLPGTWGSPLSSVLDSGRNSPYGHTQARLELDMRSPVDDHQSRFKARRPNHGAESSHPPAGDDSGSPPYVEIVISDSDEPKAKPVKKYPKKRPGTGDDEYNGSSWTDSDGTKHLGGQDDSDDDTLPITRRRRRRRPARYDD